MSKVIFTALSKKNFFQRTRISKFVLEKALIPLNPFMLFDYYLGDGVDHDLVRQANNKLVEKSDEIWVFGEISDGVEREIDIAKKLNKKIRYFDITKLPEEIKEITENQTIKEQGD